MFKFYDNDFLMYTDKEKFDEIKGAKRPVLVVTKQDDGIRLDFLYEYSETPFYRIVLHENDIPEDKQLNLLVKNNAMFWKGAPEHNPEIEVREMDDFIWKILLIMDYSDAHLCPRIQLYRHGDIVVCRPHMHTLYNEGVERHETDVWFQDIVKELNPKEKAHNNIIKERLQKEIAPLDSLSYLEAQVDILSKMVFTLVNANEDNKRLITESIPQASDFITVIEENNVMNIKPMSKCIEELQTDKMRMRELQKDYYRRKE